MKAVSLAHTATASPKVKSLGNTPFVNKVMDGEIQMIENAKADPAQFEPLYKKYYSPILKFIYKRVENLDDCRELTANVFTKALLNIGKYRDMGFPFSSWLYRIAINEINQFFRDAKKMRGVSIDEKGIRYIAAETGEQMNDLKSVLTKALHFLNEDELLLIELRFFEERPFAEVGQLLNITENNAKVRTYRVLDKLREIYKKL